MKIPKQSRLNTRAENHFKDEHEEGKFRSRVLSFLPKLPLLSILSLWPGSQVNFIIIIMMVIVMIIMKMIMRRRRGLNKDVISRQGSPP